MILKLSGSNTEYTNKTNTAPGMRLNALLNRWIVIYLLSSRAWASTSAIVIIDCIYELELRNVLIDSDSGSSTGVTTGVINSLTCSATVKTASIITLINRFLLNKLSTETFSGCV